MSKHMKKLISTLLCGAMLLSSMSLSAFAEGTDAADATTAPAATEATAAPDASAAPEATAAAAEATATPEATAAPAATEAPAAVPAANDDYFNEAIGLLSALKIFEGYEDGSIKPESTITRAEMAAVILRTLGNKSLTKYTGMFTDVAADHWAADTIQTAADLGIINGMGDGTFAPDAPVKYEQAVKMAVCALNYGAFADYNGGYPMGYLMLANRSDIKLTKSIGGALGQDATRGTVVKLIYNTINAPYPTLTGLDAQGPIYSTEDDETLASVKHKVYISEGILTATHNKSIDVGVDLTETQISIDGDVFESTITNADELVGQYVKSYYYDPTGNGGEETVIYSTPVLNKNNTLVVDALKIDRFINIDGTSPKLSYYTESDNKKNAKIVESPIIVYNNEVLTTEGFQRYRNAIIAKNEKIVNDEDKIPVPSLSDFITPDVGSVKLGDFDNDGNYDIIFVEKYVTFVVNTASEKKVTFKYDVDGYSNIDMDLDDSDYKISITRDGETIKTRHLKEYNVMSVLMNAPYLDSSYTGDKKINATVTTATLSGKPTSYDVDDDENHITYINGKKYYVDKNAVSDLRDAIGSDCTLYLDQFDRIAYVDSASAGKLTGSEKYGWIMNAYVDDGADSPSIKMFTQDGSVVKYDVDSTLNYWDKTTGSAVDLDTGSEDGKAKIVSLGTGSPYVMAKGPVRLCKYKVNSEGLITKLYIATTSDDKNGVSVNTANMSGVGSVGSLLNGYKMTGELLRFTVPSDTKDMASDASIYKIDNVQASNFLVYDGGVSEDYFLAEFDDGKPTVMIKYVGGSDELAKYTDTDTASDASVMMVSKISRAVDDDDETVYIIKGYIGAGEVEFTTTTSTIIYDMNPAEAANPKEDYTTKAGQSEGFWNGKMDESLADYLKPGDIIGIHGNVYVRFASIDNVVNDVKNGKLDGENQFYGNVTKSMTRDNITFGYLDGIDIDGSAVVNIKDEAKAPNQREIAADATIICAKVTMTKSGYKVDVTKSEDALQVFDLENFDMETKTGDFLFKRLFKNGAERETYAIRFED